MRRPIDRMAEGLRRRDVTRIHGGLYIGSAPTDPSLYQDFDVIVLCAEEFQPGSRAFPRARVRRIPFNDAPNIDGATIGRVLSGSKVVAQDLARGRRTLVTCAMGRNRSALVTALSLHYLTGAPALVCGQRVYQLRKDPTGVRALQNQSFVQLLVAVDQGRF